MARTEITGRDGFLIAQALATTHALIGELPERCREDSNRADMARLLRAMFGPDWETTARVIRHALSEADWADARALLTRDRDGAAA